MKKLNLFLIFLAVAAVAQAQSHKGNVANIDGVHLSPQTAVVVELVVKKESVVMGPYSRYATQLLGVIAPLNDKVLYSIEAVRVTGDNIGTISSVAKRKNGGNQGFEKGSLSVGNKFIDMGISPVYSEAAGEKSQKTMATDAASVIFKLRSRRFDLVTGEMGEGVFGEGLKAALAEMARIEREYTELFVGKRSVEYATYQFEVIPESGKHNYMICRFDATKGIVEGVDISGTPIVLNTIDENKVVGGAIAKSKKDSETKGSRVQVADIALCKVLLGEDLLAEKRIPVLQFGEAGERVTSTTDARK